VVVLLLCSLSVAVAAPESPWGAVVPVPTRECLDTACPDKSLWTRVDLWACVGDGHNERFRWNSSTKQLQIGPSDMGPGGASSAGYCLQGRLAADGTSAAAGALPPSPFQAQCNSSTGAQYFGSELCFEHCALFEQPMPPVCC
jgi:hypothetical protein